MSVYDHVTEFTSKAFKDWTQLSDVVAFELPGGTFYSSNASKALASQNVTGLTLGYLYRHSIDIRYCEGRHGGILSDAIAPFENQKHTEWASVLTAPFVLFCGLHMLFAWKHDDGLITLISTLFALNGVAAFLAHLLSESMWHNVDAHSMLLAIWSAFALVSMEFFDHTFKALSKVAPCCRLRCCGFVRDGFKAFAWMLAMFVYFWLAESNGAVGDHEYGHKIGALATAFPLFICVLVGSIFVCCGCAKMSIAIGSRPYKTARCRFVVGVLLGIVGATLWTATELSCDRDDDVGQFFKAFPGHAVWHVTMAYGMFNTMLFAGVLRADNFRTRVYVRTTGCCGYYWLFPQLIFDPAEGIVRPTHTGWITPSGTQQNLMAGLQMGLQHVVASPKRMFAKAKPSQIVPAPDDEEAAMEAEQLVESPPLRPGAPRPAEPC